MNDRQVYIEFGFGLFESRIGIGDAALPSYLANSANTGDGSVKTVGTQVRERLSNLGGPPVRGLSFDDNGCAVLISAWEATQDLRGRTGFLVTVGSPGSCSVSSRFAEYDVLPGIITYWLDADGPSMYIASTCSSIGSMLSVAYRLVYSGECDNVVIVGSNITPAALTVALSPIHAKNGECRPFTRNRNGCITGVGAGSLIVTSNRDSLKRPACELRSVVTLSGGSERSSFSAPDVRCQGDAVVSAWRAAGMTLADAAFLECHGTGTVIGDKIEVHALRRVLGTEPASPILIGSSKEDVGHLDAAAGIASFARSLHAACTLMTPSSSDRSVMDADLDLLGTYFRLSSKPEPIKEGDPFGVSLFGISGSATHAVCQRV